MKKLKKIFSYILIIALVFTHIMPIEASDITSYNDVPTNHWAYTYIMDLTKRDLVRGTTSIVNGQGTFAPNRNITNAEFVTILSNLLYKNQLPNYQNQTTKWYEKSYMLGLYNYLYTSTEYSFYDMEKQTTREEMAMLVARAEEQLTNKSYTPTAISNIPDYYSIGEKYRDSVRKLYSLGLVKGVDSRGTFNPKNYLTRAEAASVIYRLVHLDSKNSPAPVPEEKEVLRKTDKSTINLTNINKGYVKIKGSSSKNMKVQIIKDGGNTYTYDLNSNNQYETFSFTEGTGNYTIIVYEHKYDNRYTRLDSYTTFVNPKDEFAPFLIPTKYVNYNENNLAIAIGRQLTKNATTTQDKINILYNYVANNISYDYSKVNTIKAGYIPNIDDTIVTRKGVCVDYATLLAAMLRSQNIPCKVIYGTVDGNSHAWVNVYNGNYWIQLDPTNSKVNPYEHTYIYQYYY